jgi:hypothetical protein
MTEVIFKELPHSTSKIAVDVKVTIAKGVAIVTRLGTLVRSRNGWGYSSKRVSEAHELRQVVGKLDELNGKEADRE